MSIGRVEGREFAYLMAQLEIVSESPLPRPEEADWYYRIVGLTEQSSYREGCPRSSVFVILHDYAGGKSHLRLYRIDGLCFWEFRGVTHYGEADVNGQVLRFIARSKPNPSECYDFAVGVGPDAAEVTLIGRVEDAPWCEPR